MNPSPLTITTSLELCAKSLQPDTKHHTLLIDGRPAFANPAGIGRYTRELLHDIQRGGSSSNWIILSPCKSSPLFTWKDSPHAKLHLLEGNALVWQFQAIKTPFSEPFSLYYSPSSLIVPAFSSFPTAVTIHDLSAIEVPETQHWKTVLLEKALLRKALVKTKCIIVPSESTKVAILRHYPQTDATKIIVIKEDVGKEFTPRGEHEAKTVLERYGLHWKDYFLAVGTIEPRKNYPRLLEAYQKYRNHGGKLPLIIVGKKGWKYTPTLKAITNIHPHGSARIIENVTFEELPFLYSGAKTTFVLSLYEGYGLPAAEALACGCPVVASNTSSLPEVVGDKGVLIDPKDVAAIAREMLRI